MSVCTVNIMAATSAISSTSLCYAFSLPSRLCPAAVASKGQWHMYVIVAGSQGLARAPLFPSALWRHRHRGKGRARSCLSATAALASPPGGCAQGTERVLIHESLFFLSEDVEARISLAVSTGRLDLSDCGLEEVPPRVFEIADLVDLSLAGNNLSSLPEDIENLRALRRLGLAGNMLEELPEGIGNLHQLEGLWVHGNILHTLPPQIGELRQLRMLALAGNKLTVLPESISGLTNLQILSVAGNKLQDIPAGVGNMKALKVLAAYGNCLRRLPDSLTQLSSLQDLWLQGNKLEVLPEFWGGLCSLKQFSIADNLLQVLPNSFGQLQSLQTLWVYCNQLKGVPRSLATLKKLVYLWLEGNPLEDQDFWEFLPELSHLKSLGISSDVVVRKMIPETMEKIITLSEISGSGDARCHGGYLKLQQWDPEKKAEKVVVAFGSAPAVPNWAGLLQKVKAAMEAKGTTSPFDILYVVDSKRSWYTHEEDREISITDDAVEVLQQDGTLSDCKTRHCSSSKLGSYYKRELEVALCAYRHIIMLGDSMGASAALLFSPLATSVIAFCPQVDLSTSSIRPGQPQAWLQSYKEELLAAVSSSSAKIVVHCGTWSHDVTQAKLLPTDKVKLEVHDVNDHRLAKELNDQNMLVQLVLKEVLETTLLAHQNTAVQ